MKTSILTTCWLLGCTSSIMAEDWPSFRGPETNGISADKNVPLGMEC